MTLDRFGVVETTTLLTQIEMGEYDADLSKIFSAVETRLSKVRASKTIKDFGIGDKIKINSNCGTRYLIGHTGKVVGVKRTKLVVTFDSPIGRFARVNPATRELESANVTVPIGIVDPI